MDTQTINETILRHQPVQLTGSDVTEAFSAAERASDRSLEGRRLAAACSLSDRWPMSVCAEVARALLPGPTSVRPEGRA